MSMLAERKRKTKYVINPTKKPLWTTESTGIKFGKEIMEKMGWSAGKGLGLKEQGIQEPLRVSYKNDTKGMGFKGNDDDWIEQQDEFNSLLSQLSNNDTSSKGFLENNKTEVKSLEDKSKNSKARVHYQKFTRGKDLSRYSENDLACILGVSKSKKQNSKSDELTKHQVNENAGSQYETSFGVTTVNSGSIQDYFKKKWSSGETKSTSVSEPVIKAQENQHESFLGFSEAASNEAEVKLEKSKKKKLKLICNESEYFDKSSTENDLNYSQGGDKNEESRHMKKKHNSKQKTEPSDTLQNNEYELTKVAEDKSEKKDSTKGEKSFEEEIRTKKKKKKSYKDEAGEENQTQSSESNAKSQSLPSDEALIHLEAEDKKSKKDKYKLMAVTEKMSPVENKNSEENVNIISEDKKSKKKNSTSKSKTRTFQVKDSIELVDFVTDIISEENKKNKVDLAEKKSKFERKRKTYSDEEHFIHEGQTINYCEKESIQNINCEDYTCRVQGECNMKSDSNGEKKSKKRKHVCGAEAEEILEFPHNDEDIKLESKEKKSKKRKRNSNSGAEAEEILEFVHNDEVIKSESKEKKSKKRKHNFDSDVNAEQELESAINEKENIKSESKEEKKKKKRKNDCDSEVETNKALNVFNKDEHNVLKMIDKLDSKEKKSKKKRHNSHSKVEVEEVVEFTKSNENIKSESKEEKSKKKRHNCNSEVGAKETMKGVTSNDEEIRSESKKDKKKKKRKSKSDSEVVVEDKNAGPDDADYLDQEEKEKEKRKRDYSNNCDLTSMNEGNFLGTVAEYKHLESLENHTRSSTKKERKEKNEVELTGNEGNENGERKIKKQKRNSLKCAKDKHVGECEEANDSVSNNSSPVTNIDMNEEEVSEERNSTKKKKKKKEKDNKERENRKDEIKKEISHTDEVAKAKKQKFENEEKAKAKNESAENDSSVGKLKVSEGDKNESASTKIKEVVAVENEKQKQSTELYKPDTYTPEKVLELIRWADVKEFRGSNLGNILGYGLKKQFMNKVR